MPDLHRPAYHFTTDNWMNDPIPFYHEGVYHIYYQYNPNAAVWGDMHWGHAISRDFCYWQTRPIALAPTPDGPDKDGVFTGCVTQSRADGRFYALYTGVSPQVQCVAVSDDLETWEKYAGNPVVSVRPPAEDVGEWGDCFRDPQTFFGPDGQRYLVIGGEQPNGAGGAAFLYRVDDEAGMTEWQYQHPLCLGGPETGFDFECPDFFPLGDTWLLITSRHRTWWHSGTLSKDMKFTVEAIGPCDTSLFYAAKTLTDRSGRRLLFGWIREARPEAAQVAAGWSGVLSLPRVVTMAEDGTPRFAPAPELTRLRHDSVTWETVLSEKSASLGTFGNLLEILATVRNPLGLATLTLACGDAEPVVIDVPPAQENHLHVFIDRSVIEVFINGRECRTVRVYPVQAGEVTISAKGMGSGTTLTATFYTILPRHPYNE